ncbi:hypothetical protein QFZ82_001687 [Streptomyces sp. V4I23]|uniref:hypothetical protein n=1 Tax=Streptomyces sp. V4I23 TaxID=3042282 RepID=UPI0027802D39|nr:hypothetical protein [Streptomyces sp. V4I23]MDQ1007202.1 hypothetical protein [Streptomyces sp. V4I23]
MDDHFEGFFKTYLDLEQAYDTSGYVRPTLMGFSESYVRAVRDGFTKALADDSFGVAEYERLTDIEFADKATLRLYLENLYAYLFEGSEGPPIPPE